MTTEPPVPGGRKILIIGIGAGNPEHITIQAINALKEIDVLFLTDKGEDKSDLLRIRKEICERYIPDASYRVVQFNDPESVTAPLLIVQRSKTGTASARRCTRN